MHLLFEASILLQKLGERNAGKSLAISKIKSQLPLLPLSRLSGRSIMMCPLSPPFSILSMYGIYPRIVAPIDLVYLSLFFCPPLYIPLLFCAGGIQIQLSPPQCSPKIFFRHGTAGINSVVARALPPPPSFRALSDRSAL